MGFHTRDIKEKCVKCKEYHDTRLIPGSDFPTDFCTLANMECSQIKSCDRNAFAWVKK